MSLSNKTVKLFFSRTSVLLVVAFALVFQFPMVAHAQINEQERDDEYYFRNNISWLHFDEMCAAGDAANVSSGGSVGTDFNLGSDPMERRVNLVKALMADYGLTAEQASGPVGNFMHESGGEHVPPNINEGGVAGPPRFSGGYGWAQWTGSRQVTFIDFAVSKDYMASKNVDATDAANYAYLKKELNEGYKATIADLKKQKTPESAAVSFEATFERAGVPALEERKAGARKVFEEYSKGSGGSGTDSGSTDSAAASCASASANGAAVVGDVAFPLATTKSGIQNRNMFSNGTADQGGHPYIAYDILTSPGTEVVAFMGGQVTNISSDRCPGRLIGIYNKESNVTVSYMHLAFDGHIKEGATVKPGDFVGKVGPASAGCGIAHLHIDVIKGKIRYGCSRLGCSSSVQRMFVNIGPELFETFQALPE